MTGAAFPKGCNQVNPVENLVFVENSINKEVFFKEEPKNQFFAKKGEDSKKGDLLFGKGPLARFKSRGCLCYTRLNSNLRFFCSACSHFGYR